ncbi:MAG: tetratricopeptide repeat protein [Myxococcota bacterium]
MSDSTPSSARAEAAAAFAALINEGRAHSESEAFEKARDAFDRAVQLLPLHPDGYLERGCVAAILGDPQAAIDDLGACLVLSSPEHDDPSRAHFNRGTVLLDTYQGGRATYHFAAATVAGVEEAKSLFTRAKAAGTQAGFDPVGAAEDAARRGFDVIASNPAAALACFADAKLYAPTMLVAVHGLGLAHGAMRNREAARSAFTTVIEEAEGTMKAEAYYNRAMLSSPKDDPTQRAAAADDLEACIAMAEDPDVAFPVMGDPVQAGALVERMRAQLAAMRA